MNKSIDLVTRLSARYFKLMADFQAEMNRVVSGFVAQVTELARQAAREMIDQALGNTGRGAGRRAAQINRSRDGKRTQADLEKLSKSFLAFVAKNPGLRIEQINKQLGTTTKELALPIRKLVADGALKTKGKKRSTTYFGGKN